MKKFKEFLKAMKFSDYVYWGMTLVPFLITLVFYSRLPEQVPTHWNSAGEVNGYSSKLMAGFGIPLFMVFMAVAVNISIWADPKRANIARSKELREITRWFIVVLAILMQAVIMLSGVGVKLNVRLVASVPIGILCMVMGNYFPKCRQNYSMGIKLPWTLTDEENWTRTHRLAGYVWTVGGAAMVVCGIAGWSCLFFGIMIVMAMIPAVYSFLIYRRKMGGKG